MNRGGCSDLGGLKCLKDYKCEIAHTKFQYISIQSIQFLPKIFNAFLSKVFNKFLPKVFNKFLSWKSFKPPF